MSGLLLAALLACGVRGDPAVTHAFGAARARVAPDPSEPADGWQPDIELRLGHALLTEAARAGVASRGPVTWASSGAVDASATFTVTELTLGDGDAACPSCLPVDLTLVGDVKAKGRFRTTTTRTTTRVRLHLEMTARREPGALVLEASLGRLDRVRVDVAGLGPLLANTIEPLVGARVADALRSRQVAVPITRLSTAEVPARAARVTTDREGVRVQLRSDVGAGGLLDGPASPASADEALTLRIDSATLVALAARKTLARAPGPRGVLVEPTGLRLADGAFSLDARLWRPAPPAWWRDITVDGNIALQGAELTLTATGVTPRGASDGADIADPLVAVAEATVLQLVPGVLTAAVPTAGRGDMDGRPVQPVLRAVEGAGDDVVLRAAATVAPR